jgi:hypothetical protein
VAEGKTLIIKGESLGTGKLTASSNGNGCGIGGGFSLSCGNILIEGGVITAQGGNYNAGIGVGHGNNTNHTKCGNITITGGTVKATSFAHGAGIGSGFSYSDCGDILISGGTVEATGGFLAAGIGSGFSYSDCGDILISGGTVEATGGTFAAGIGSGNSTSSCGTITITTDVAKVTATMGNGSDNSIGAGNNSSCGTVTIGCELDSEGKPKSGTGTVYYDDDGYQNGGATYLAQSPLTLVNLGKLTGNYEAPNGTTLFGTLDGTTQKYKVSFADGATVTLDGVDIEGVNDYNCQWAGLNCTGDATIVLNDGSTNTVKGFHESYPGILVHWGGKLTIKGGTKGTGKLTASPFDGGKDDSTGAGIGGASNFYGQTIGSIEIQGGIISASGGIYAAGIGCSSNGHYGDIIISGGEITAKGGQLAAGIGSGLSGVQSSSCNISITGGIVDATSGPIGSGIGSGGGDYYFDNFYYSSCNNITITGGTIKATGGRESAGIGTSYQYSVCGNITITSDVTLVTATKGENADESIGIGYTKSDRHNSCGTVTIGGQEYPDRITDSPYTYQPSH